jgi:threonine dehydratase
MNVERLGVLPHAVVQKYHVPIVAISEGLLVEAMSLHYWEDGVIVEAAAAAPLAALLGYAPRFYGKRVALVLSGANVDRDVFSGIVARTQRAS